MERSREYEDLAIALAEVRPTPRSDFEGELDQLVAAGFPRKSPIGRLQAIVTRFRGLSPQRLLVASGAAAFIAIAIATIVISNTGSSPAPIALEQHAAKQPSGASGAQYSEALPQVAGNVAGSGAVNGSAGALQGSAEALKHHSSSFSDSSPSYTPLSRATHRDIERSAEIGLLADPADVADDSAKVFSAVHDARGIVLHSTTTAGRNAGASFDLLIPSARLGDALAAFSAIDEVRSRHEATADVTAPTVSVSKELHYAEAWADRLQTQLSSTESEPEREDAEIVLHSVRRHAAQLRAQLARLHRRTTFSRVSLRIEAGPSTDTSGGGWGVGDAWGDAGHILGIAAGVTVVGLAVIAPLALLFLLAWLAHRLWLRSRRERALDA